LALKKIRGYLSGLSDEYKEPYDSNLLNKCNTLLGRYDEIYENYSKLLNVVDDDIIFSKKMAILSTNPYIFIEEFSSLLSEVSDLTNKIAIKFENKYKLQQQKMESQDVTIDMVKAKIADLCTMYSKTKEVLNNVIK